MSEDCVNCGCQAHAHSPRTGNACAQYETLTGIRAERDALRAQLAPQHELELRLRRERDEKARQAELYHADMMRVREQRDKARAEVERLTSAEAAK